MGADSFVVSRRLGKKRAEKTAGVAVEEVVDFYNDRMATKVDVLELRGDVLELRDGLVRLEANAATKDDLRRLEVNSASKADVSELREKVVWLEINAATKADVSELREKVVQLEINAATKDDLRRLEASSKVDIAEVRVGLARLDEKVDSKFSVIIHLFLGILVTAVGAVGGAVWAFFLS